ncbi:hypothetical protein TWF730_002757 [Orbilia blumenaviensis]|uniref:Mid2 domain-containing protein n=1 Tax=Orbilia blumenaviensis TaxID=1796055 RepID=A0AAV9U731_9PEZI
MLLTGFIRATVCALGLSTVGALSNPAGTGVSMRSTHPEMSAHEVMRLIGRSLSEVSHQKRQTIFSNSSYFEKSWDGAVLLSLQQEASGEISATESVDTTYGIEITCTTCYIKAGVLAELVIERPFNISETFNNFTDQIGAEIANTTEATFDYIKDSVSGIFENLSDGFDLDDFDLPPLDIDFNIDIPEIPEVTLRFQFDELELYVALETVFSAGITYTLNLYTSQTPYGVMITEDLFFGVVVSVDLILSADSEITINSGFHIRVDDGAEIRLALFGEDVAETDFKGGQFEFLPVTIESAGVVLKAVLRVKVRAGFEVSTTPLRVLGIPVGDILQASAGVEVSVWTHIAELTTNVTITPAGEEEDGCQLRVEEGYQFGIGAAAGATVALADHTWGPAPSTTVPLFFTTITQCAIRRPPASTVTSLATVITSSPPSSEAGITSAPTIAPRQADETGAISSDGLTTTTTVSVVTYRAVQCMSYEMADCPVSLQKTTKVTSRVTLTTAVPSGVVATFPETIRTTGVQPITFGTAANKLFETAGPPTAYTPPPESRLSKFLDGEIGGVDKRIIFGVSIGGGILVLGLIIGAIVYCYRKRKYKAVAQPRGDQITTYHDVPYKPGLKYDTSYGVQTTTMEIRRASS